MDLFNNVSETYSSDGSFLLNYSSVENAAKNINNESDGEWD